MGNTPHSGAGRRQVIAAPRSSVLRAALAALVLAPALAVAGPADKVYTPQVEQGETEFEFRSGFQSGPSEHAFIADIGYGFTPWWFSEVVGEFEGAPGENTRYAALEWENIFLLTEPGKYWADVGIFFEYAHTRDSDEPDEIEIGPMFQKEFGDLQVNLNPLFERTVGRNDSGKTELAYRAQMKWRGNERFEPGLQAIGSAGFFGEIGREKEHKLGPAFFGTMRLDNRNKIKYDAALLFGLNHDAPDTTLRLTFEYEMY